MQKKIARMYALINISVVFRFFFLGGGSFSANGFCGNITQLDNAKLFIRSSWSFNTINKTYSAPQGRIEDYSSMYIY